MPLIQTERYELDPRPIGHGGFGEIYLATDLLFNRKVVIKTILASQLYGIDEPVLRKQFFKESVICAKLGLECQHIVKVLDYGYDRDSSLPFFVMEYIEGYDLFGQIGKFTWEAAIPLLDQMLQALEVAHKEDVIHSDISPDNIMYDSREQIYKLNDFGLAKLLSSTLMRRGSTLSLVGGKPKYLPILDWHTGNRTPHSDLYGLVVTLIQLITGKLPEWEYVGTELKPPQVKELFPNMSDETITITRSGHIPHPQKGMFTLTPKLIEQTMEYLRHAQTNEYVIRISTSELIEIFAKIISGNIRSVEDANQAIRLSIEASTGPLLAHQTKINRVIREENPESKLEIK